jgi:hypothetical protein
MFLFGAGSRCLLSSVYQEVCCYTPGPGWFGGCFSEVRGAPQEKLHWTTAAAGQKASAQGCRFEASKSKGGSHQLGMSTVHMCPISYDLGVLQSSIYWLMSNISFTGGPVRLSTLRHVLATATGRDAPPNTAGGET